MEAGRQTKQPTHLKLSSVCELVASLSSAVSMSVVSAKSVAAPAAAVATGDEEEDVGEQGVYVTLLCCGSRRSRMSCMAMDSDAYRI